MPGWDEESAVIQKIDSLRSKVPWMSVPELLDAIILTLDLYRMTLRFGETDSRRSNIEKLRSLALDYEGWCKRFSRAPNGAGFIMWLEEQPDELTDRQGAGRGRQAVNVMTYHAAKGLEWPVEKQTGTVAMKGAICRWLSYIAAVVFLRHIHCRDKDHTSLLAHVPISRDS